MKRSTSMKAVTIGLMTVSAFALSACQEDPQAMSFSTVEQCVSAAETMVKNVDSITATDCRDSFLEAQAEHVETAPRYDAMAVCEEEHGAGACQPEVRSDGSSVFMPFFAGYMMASVMDDIGDSKKKKRVYSTPVYAVKGGGFMPASGNAYFSNLGTKKYVSTSAFTRATATVKAPPMTKATVTARSGFGAARTGGSFGG